MKVHRQRVSVGDRVWFLIGGVQAGLYVVGTIVSPVYEIEQDDGFGKWKIDVTYDAYIDPPLLRPELLAVPELTSFHPLRGIMGTNFEVPGPIAIVLREMAKGRLSPIPGGQLEVIKEAVTVDQALRHHNQAVKTQLRSAINALSPDDFEMFIARVLEVLGFVDVQVLGKTGDGGVDVRGVLTVGGITSVKTVVQAKRWAKTVGARVVRDLRGALQVDERGLIISTAEFSQSAIDEATAPGKVSIGLLGGTGLADICLENSIGVVAKPVRIYSLAPGALT